MPRAFPLGSRDGQGGTAGNVPHPGPKMGSHGLGLFLVVGVATRAGTAPPENRTLGLWIVSGLAILLGAFMVLRLAHCGLAVFPDRIRIINPVKTVTIPKQQLVGFSASEGMSGIRVQTSDG